jgi:hypothetical protein
MNFLKTVYFSMMTSIVLAANAFCEETSKAENLDEVGNFVAKVKGASSWSDDLVPIAVFITVIAIVWLKHRAKVQIARARLEAVKILAEKGQPIPEGVLKDMGGSAAEKEKKSPTSKAITHISIGLAFVVYFLLNGHHNGALAVGIGFLALGAGNLWLANKNK